MVGFDYFCVKVKTKELFGGKKEKKHDKMGLTSFLPVVDQPSSHPASIGRVESR